MSEPWATVVAHTKYISGEIKHDTYANIIKACIKLQCKNELNSTINRILFKQPVWGSAEVNLKGETKITIL